MWSGALDALPTGWKICDGTNSTPDLTNKFILGSKPSGGGDPTVGQSGGDHAPNISATQLPAHTHQIADQADHAHGTQASGSHQHYCKGTYGKQFVGRGNAIQYNTYTNSPVMACHVSGWQNGGNVIINQIRAAGVGNHQHGIDGGGGHSHGGDTADQSGTTGQAFDNRPAYYVLAFIMKI